MAWAGLVALQAAKSAGDSGGADWTAIVTAGAAVVGALGVLLVLVQITEGRRSRDAQITADISRRWDEDPLRSVRKMVSDCGPPNEGGNKVVRLTLVQYFWNKDPRYYELLTEPNYFEDLAILCKHKALDSELVRQSFGGLVDKRWKRWNLAVHWLRRDDPHIYENFQWLAREMSREAPRLRGFKKLRHWAACWINPPEWT